MESHLSSWKGRWLSWIGRLTLIKIVVVALPIYMLSFVPLMGDTCNKINQKMKNFFWKGDLDQKKFPLIKWEKICRVWEEAGTGINNLSLQNKALGAKLAW